MAQLKLMLAVLFVVLSMASAMSMIENILENGRENPDGARNWSYEEEDEVDKLKQVISDLESKLKRLNVTDELDGSDIAFFENNSEEEEGEEEKVNYYVDYGQPIHGMDSEEINSVQEQVDYKGRKWEAHA